MFIHYRSPGLIFQKEDRGDADQLFRVFTRDFGRLEILGKAIRKINSKLRSGADIFFLSDIEFIQGKSQKTLTDAILINKFNNLRSDLAKLNIAQDISEVLEKLLKGQEPDEQIWQLLIETFEKLDKLEIENSLEIINWKLEIVFYYFLWNFFSILGYKLDLYYCGSCQKKLKPEKNYFVENTGIVCQNCSGNIKSAKELSLDILKILRLILEKDFKTLLRLKMAAEQLKELAIFSKNYNLAICENF